MAEEKKKGLSAAEEQQRRLNDLRIQKEELDIQDLTYRLENEMARRAAIARAHKNQQDSIDDFNRQVAAERAFCSHKKGGKNLPGILKGTDAYYSVWKHTYPWGATEVMCTRCGNEWKKPADELRKENPQLYKVKMKEYVDALNFPTDNEPSGNAIFLIERSA